MLKQLKLMIFVNAVFVALFVFFNWAQYSAIRSLGSPVYVTTNFPWYVQYEGAENAVKIFVDSNFTLFLFLFAIFVNMYFIYKLEASKETKQTPSS